MTGSASSTRKISDEAVLKATGRTWEQWFAVLDADGAGKLSHKQIAELINRKYLDSGWWSQMVTVVYEQARGLRELHRKADGFAASASKTFNVSVEQLFSAWTDTVTRAAWLAEQGIEVTKSKANESLRMLWSDGKTRVDVNFYPKGAEKSQVSVQHTKLDSAEDVAKSRNSWKEAFARLQETLSKYG